MKKFLSAGIALWAAGTVAHAADMTLAVAPAAAAYDWTGSYVGLTAGAAWGRYNTQTWTDAEGFVRPQGAAAIIGAGAQTIKPEGFLTGIEGGYNRQIGSLVFGLEADAQALHLNGATGSAAVPFPGNPVNSFTVTSYGNSDWLVTARPRFGVVAPGNWLLYVTGGLAVTELQSDFSFVTNTNARISGKLDTIKPGYTFGGGIERPLTNRLSLKAEYLHVDFAGTAGPQTFSNITARFPNQFFLFSSDLRADILRAGLNYRFGVADAPADGGAMPLKAPALVAPLSVANWEFAVGARVWLSSGSIGAPQPLIDVPQQVLASRLIYSGLDAVSGETFARADHASGFFVKGYLGAGAITGGQLNDEDFPGGNAYSNTLEAATGHIGYATIDVGYNFLRAPGAKVGAFIGFNHYMLAVNTYGCAQLAGSDVCSPALPSNLLTLTQNAAFNSLRVGLSSEVMLTPRLKLTADVAYVPLVDFAGLDDHLLRQLLLFEGANAGNGVMLEAMLDYQITDAWSVGVGARYWAWNMNTGSETFLFLNNPSFPNPETGRFTAERVGAFVQTSYRWGDAAPGPAAAMPTKAPVLPTGPVNWTGVYAGGYLAGGASDGRWSDPFGSAPAGFPFFLGINIAGFGDLTHATGPLAGGQVGADWQTGPWVLGVALDASAADLRGENTCFSGLGGINCRHTVYALATATGRAGYAFDRSLAYVKAGAAWADTTYDLYGNTIAGLFVGQLGSDGANLGTWGWTAGGGVEYALTPRWTTFAEYDHIGLPATVVSFPAVAVINTQAISVKQSIDLFKLGVNCRFDLGTIGANL